jgi:hypothetical protein
MNPIGNETTILHLGQGQWLAASREGSDTHLEKIISHDDGRTWARVGALTKSCQVPGHLLKLQNGKVLLSYGNRIENQCGVEAKISADNGTSWSDTIRLANMPVWDGGYASSVERDDGMIVTAYYSQHPERGPYQYQMGAVTWKP